MKPTYILLFALGAAVVAGCQSQNTESAKLEHYRKVYKKSIAYGDNVAATNAIYNQWVDDSINGFLYKDSLANLYFKNGQYYQALALAKELLSLQADNLELQEIVAASDQSVNNLTEALDYYQKIYAKTHYLYHLYQIALLQFDLTRVAECGQTINRILADSASANQKIQLNVGQGLQQVVPYRAAVLNMRGVIAKGLNENDLAEKSFKRALAIDPDFVLAKNNLVPAKK